MSSTGKRIVSQTSIYMLGDIIRQSASLIMLPIYTRYLTPADYGVIELLSMIIDFASIIFGARVAQAVFRFYCTASSEEDKKSVIASALFLAVLFNGIGAIVVSLLSGPLAVAIFSDYGFRNYIILFSIIMFLLPLFQIPLTYIRAQQKPWLFLAFSVTKLIVQLALNIYFVVYREMHVEGVIYSAIITNVFMAILLTGYTLPRTGVRATKANCKKLFSFSLPLKLAAICSFYLTFGDRYILTIYTDLSQIGIYSLGYKFGFIFILLTMTPFEKMWDSEKYEIYKQPNAKHTYQRIFLYMSFFLILIGLCISLLSKDLIRIMSTPAFLSAHEIVPIIILAYIFQAWAKYCSLGILLENKTMQLAYAEAIAAIIITGAYFTLIPTYGIFGAAWATVIGFVARFYWTNRKAKQFYNMELPWRKVGMTLALAFFAFALSLLAPDELVASVLIHVTIIASFTAAFFALPILSRNEKREIWEKVKELKSTIRP